MNNLYPFETERSSLLGTEAFRNLLSESLKKAEKNVIILSAYISSTGINRQGVNEKGVSRSKQLFYAS